MDNDKPVDGTPGGLPEQFELHPRLEAVRFLLGRWEGAGVVGYPTIESANFGQEISFSHNGKPFLIYASRTWLIEEDGTIGRPLAMETGFQPVGQAAALKKVTMRAGAPSWAAALEAIATVATDNNANNAFRPWRTE